MPRIFLSALNTPQNSDNLVYNGTDIAISVCGKLTLLNIEKGSVDLEYPLSDSLTILGRISLDNYQCYVSNRLNVDCINIKTKKLAWRAFNANLFGSYKTHIIALSLDGKYYLIINKETGKIESKILKSSDRDLIFLGGYVLIYSPKYTSLYQ